MYLDGDIVLRSVGRKGRGEIGKGRGQSSAFGVLVALPRNHFSEQSEENNLSRS
jgi:hypothetical protein